MERFLKFIGEMNDVIKRVKSGEITKEEADDLLKGIRDKHMKNGDTSREELLARAIENNANFRNLPIWKEDLDEGWQQVRRTINTIGSLQERFLMEDMEHDPRQTLTYVQYRYREDAHKALSQLVSELMSYAKIMGVVDMTPFIEWEKENGKGE